MTNFDLACLNSQTATAKTLANDAPAMSWMYYTFIRNATASSQVTIHKTEVFHCHTVIFSVHSHEAM